MQRVGWQTRLCSLLNSMSHFLKCLHLKWPAYQAFEVSEKTASDISCCFGVFSVPCLNILGRHEGSKTKDDHSDHTVNINWPS